MTARLAQRNRPGVKTFYVNSDSGANYVVTHVRRAGMRRWSCTCPDFTFRRQTKGSYRACKHIREVRSGQFANRKIVSFDPLRTIEGQLRASIAIVESKKESHA